MNNNVKISFELPEDNTVASILSDIMRNNNIMETPEENFEKIINNEESRLIILRDAVKVIVKKKISEAKLAELLAKHLKITFDAAQKIITEIKEKLVPYAKIVDLTKKTETENKEKTEREKENFKEHLLKKIKIGTDALTDKITESNVPETNIKEKPAFSVEENAKLIEQKKKNDTARQKEEFLKKEQGKKEKPINSNDPYRESIE